MSVKTQGTEMFVVDRSSDPVAVMKLKCPTGITGATAGPATQIDTTCLDAKTDSTSEAGLSAPSAITVPFIMDPQDASHQYLYVLKASKEKVRWVVGLSDGAVLPTIDGQVMTLPTGRTWLPFDGYVVDVDLAVDGNEVVRGTLTIQRSGPVIPAWKAAS